MTTMQALSGAGFPGVPSLSIQENVIPYIKNEEEKVAAEAKKILGTFERRGDKAQPARDGDILQPRRRHRRAHGDALRGVRPTRSPRRRPRGLSSGSGESLRRSSSPRRRTSR